MRQGTIDHPGRGRRDEYLRYIRLVVPRPLVMAFRFVRPCFVLNSSLFRLLNAICGENSSLFRLLRESTEKKP